MFSNMKESSVDGVGVFVWLSMTPEAYLWYLWVKESRKTLQVILWGPWMPPNSLDFQSGPKRPDYIANLDGGRAH